MSVQNHQPMSLSRPEPIYWLGGSDCRYPGTQLAIDHFVLDDNSIYVLAGRERALWVGTSRDLIDDTASRSQFRSAIAMASIALQLPAPRNDLERMWLIADLETGHLAQRPTTLNAA